MLDTDAFDDLESKDQSQIDAANKKEGDAVNPSASDAKGSKCP